MKYLRDSDVADYYGVSKPTIWRWARLSVNGFPKPIKLSENMSRWTSDQIAAHDKNLIANHNKQR